MTTQSKKAHLLIMRGSMIIMVLRKVLNFRTILGITIPKQYTKTLELNPGDHIELSLLDSKTMIIKKHHTEPIKLTTADKIMARRAYNADI